MIRGETIVCFAPDPWDDIWRNRHQIMTRLARQNTVVYVEPRAYWHQALRQVRLDRGASLRSATRREAGLTVYRPPLFAPIIGRWPASAVTRVLRRRDLLRALRRLGGGQPIVWLFRPDQDDVPGQLGEKLCIYHIVDEYSGYVGVDAARREAFLERERRLMARADLVFVTSEALLDAKRGVNPRTFWVPNGVDAEAFGRAAAEGRLPADMAALPEPRIGYVGALNDKIDFGLLRRLAEARPDWTLALVGPWRVREDTDAEACRALPNVRWLGARPVAEVPAYVAGMQVCLLPYKRNEWTRNIDPLKLYEYLAAGRPVVATDIPAARGWSGRVIIADCDAYFQEAVEALLGELSPEDVAERQAAVVGHTWDARVETLSRHIADALAEAG